MMLHEILLSTSLPRPAPHARAGLLEVNRITPKEDDAIISISINKV